MPTPYPFQSGATLLASQMNSLSQLPTVSITANSTAVATHAYSRVIANGSAITYTIPNSVFEAGQVIEFHNINSTTCTIAAGAGVTVNAAAALTIEQYQAATIYATSASSFIVFESAVRPGLELVSATTIGTTVSSVAVSNVFSSTYDNYRIIVIGGVASGNVALNMQLESTNTAYYWSGMFSPFDNSGTGAVNGNNVAQWRVGVGQTSNISATFDLMSPNLAKTTTYCGFWSNTLAGANENTAWVAGFQNSTTQFTGFTILPSTGTLTGGTIRVYGYRN